MGARTRCAALCGMLALAAGCGRRSGEKSPCPAATRIEKLTSSIDISAQGPFDWKSFTIAKTRWGEGGARLEIFVANQDYTPEQMSALASPVKQIGHGFVALTLHNAGNPVTAGEYRYGGFKKPFSALAEIGIRGRTVSPGFDQGVVRVVEMRRGRVCGDFELRGRESVLKGAFVAPVASR